MAATLARFVTSQLKPALTVFQKCRHLHPSSAIIRRSFAGSSTLFDDKKYSTDHEWVMLQDDQTGQIGITDFAQGQLGDVVFIELPEVGATYERAEPFGTVESVKAASDVNAPVSGEVVEVNTALEGEPGLVNVSPYDEGWLVRMKLSDISELDDLMTKEQYEKYIEEAES
ncbi:glycine cleavage system H protein-like [Diadema antillarum]|uniref:glycine cleavage system H protein-like n=1 Tax=Diadema antillarum TaxID=105358 RepID=UPI003A87DA4A